MAAKVLDEMEFTESAVYFMSDTVSRVVLPIIEDHTCTAVVAPRVATKGNCTVLKEHRSGRTGASSSGGDLAQRFAQKLPQKIVEARITTRQSHCCKQREHRLHVGLEHLYRKDKNVVTLTFAVNPTLLVCFRMHPLQDLWQIQS